MNQTITSEIIYYLKKYDKIIIYRHQFPDPDAYGSQVALKEIIEASFDNKQVDLMGESSSQLSYIGEMSHQENLMIDETYLGIVLDVGELERVDGQGLLNCGAIIKIDHHQSSKKTFETCSWLDATYPATCLMLVDLLIKEKAYLKSTKKAREALYIGIVADTGRFEYLDNPTDVFSKITEITYDIDAKKLYSQHYKQSIERVKFLGYIYSHFEQRRNKVAVLKVTQEVLDLFKLKPMEAARMVNALRNIEGVITWHFFAEDRETGTVICEFRSSGPSIHQIAAKYGGGGHVLAAGTRVADWGVVEEIIKDLEENQKNV